MPQPGPHQTHDMQAKLALNLSITIITIVILSSCFGPHSSRATTPQLQGGMSLNLHEASQQETHPSIYKNKPQPLIAWQWRRSPHSNGPSNLHVVIIYLPHSEPHPSYYIGALSGGGNQSIPHSPHSNSASKKAELKLTSVPKSRNNTLASLR